VVFPLEATPLGGDGGTSPTLSPTFDIASPNG
jgi:hypothetical protein